MAKRKSRDTRANYLSKHGGRMSLRQRLKHTMGTVEHYAEMVGKLNVQNSECVDALQAARYAAKWYRERWVFTMLALIVALLAVAGGLVLE